MTRRTGTQSRRSSTTSRIATRKRTPRMERPGRSTARPEPQMRSLSSPRTPRKILDQQTVTKFSLSANRRNAPMGRSSSVRSCRAGNSPLGSGHAAAARRVGARPCAGGDGRGGDSPPRIARALTAPVSAAGGAGSGGERLGSRLAQGRTKSSGPNGSSNRSIYARAAASVENVPIGL